MERNLTLEEFLLENKVSDLKEDIHIKGRLEKFTFKIRAISSEKYNELFKSCTTFIKGPNGTTKANTDQELLTAKVLIEGCEYPDFKNAEWLQKAGLPNQPVKAVAKLLTAGEAGQLGKKIQELSGFIMDEDKADEEAKN